MTFSQQPHSWEYNGLGLALKYTQNATEVWMSGSLTGSMEPDPVSAMDTTFILHL